MKKYNLRMKYGTHFMAEGDAGGGDTGDAGETSWRDSLPEEIRGDKALADFSDVGGMAKAYLDTKADVGRSLRLPGPDASVEDINAFNTSLMQKVPGLTAIPGEEAPKEVTDEFFRQLGRPDDPSGYKLPETRDENSKAGLDELKQLAHSLGLPKKQFEKLSAKLVEQHNSQIEKVVADRAADWDNLKVDWGTGLEGKTKAILELARATDAPESLTNAITNRAIDSGTMKWLNSLVDSMSGDSQLNFQGAGSQETRTSPAEADAQINEIMAKPEYWDPASPLHAGLAKKVVELGKLAAG